MREVFVEFTRPKGKILPIYSWLIRAIEGTPYSHVRIRWESTSGVELIYEAGGSAVRLIGEQAQDKHPVEVVKHYRFRITKDQYRNLIKLFRFAGVKYSIIQALGIPVSKLLGLKKNPFAQGRKSQVCSELVGIFLKEVLQIQADIDLDLAGPKEIDSILRQVVVREIQ